MKKFTLIFILCIAIVNWSYSQCTTQGYQWPSSTVTVAASPGAQTIASNNWPDNEFSVLTGIVPGETYTVAANMYITVTESDGTTVIVHGANSVTFTAAAGVTDIMCFWTLDALCNGSGGPDTVTTIECTTCTCTETAAPGAVTTPTPANAAVDIPIDSTDPANLLITPFSWVDATIGGTIESYNISLGTTVTGDDIGTLTGATNGNGITFNWVNGTTYYWKVEAVNCFGSTTSAVWSFTTSACTATAVPGVATTPTPADAAIDIAIDATDPANLLVTPFSWVEATTGEAATSFNINLGTDTAGTDIGTLTGATNGNGITFNWAYDTTYYWSIEAENCFGKTAGPVWSFTTASDPLSVDENELNLFKVYPNPVKNIITIETGLTIDSIDVVNQIGQNVLTLNSNRIINNQVDLSSLSQGLYFMNIRSGDKSESIKIIKE